MIKSTLQLVLILVAACAYAPRRSLADRAPASFPGIGQTDLGSVLYDGPYLHGVSPDRRAARVYLPRQYESQESWPLVILLHGFSGTGDAEDLYLGLRFRVSLKGFILATPNGTLTPEGTKGERGEDLSGNPFWNATDACCDFGHTGTDDVSYIERLIAELKAKYRINSRRVYLFGHSNGGFMANRLACELTGQFAGIAVLGGGTFANATKCRAAAATPYLHVHASDDKTIRFEETAEYAGARASIDQWRVRNGCSSVQVAGPARDLVLLVPDADTSSQSWRQCTSGRPVELWTIRAHENRLHNPHIPVFQVDFTDRVLEFLLHNR